MQCDFAIGPIAPFWPVALNVRNTSIILNGEDTLIPHNTNIVVATKKAIHDDTRLQMLSRKRRVMILFPIKLSSIENNVLWL